MLISSDYKRKISAPISEGKYLLQFKKKKTQSLVKIPLLAKAEKIYLHYLNHCENDPYIIPHLSNQKLNSYLKEIADSCGIDKNLTFHLARHTFATTVTLTNGVPIETISKLLGHSSIRMMQIYAQVVEKKLTDDIAKLEEFLKKKRNQI